MKGPSSPILLDAWAARSCPVKTQNAYDPTLSEPVGDPRDDELFAGAEAHLTVICDALAAVTDAVDLRSVTLSVAGRRVATRRAIEAGAPVIVCPELPSSPQEHRTGSPNALVLAGKRADGGPGYLPVIVKDYLVLESHHTLAEFTWVSPLNDPDPRHARMSLDQTFRAGRERALIQAAHHWRLLEGLGLVATPDECPSHRRLVGLVGHDEIGILDDNLAVSWLDLDHKFIRTFSRSSASGWRRRSVLDRYDHEHTFRVSVAEHAIAGGEPMVAPIVVRECESCQWWAICEPRLDDADLSLRISKAPLDVREISTLRRLGVPPSTTWPTPTWTSCCRSTCLRFNTVPDPNNDSGRPPVARASSVRESCWSATMRDPSRWPRPDWNSTSTSRPLRMAGSICGVSRSVILNACSTRRPVTCPITSPSASSLTWATTMRTHWPPAPSPGSTRSSRPTRRRSWSTTPTTRSSICVISATSARTWRLVKRYVGCWTPAVSLTSSPPSRAHFFGVNGIGLKVVANAGAGFSWRDPDPGGLNSQTWWDLAVHDPDPQVRESSRTRVMEYNEDDVKATLAVRRWLAERPSE